MAQYKVVYEAGTNDTLVVIFTSVGENLDFQRSIKTMGKSDAGDNCHMAHAQDLGKTWFNDKEAFVGIKRRIGELQDQLNPKRTVFLGLSKGGFGAILFSKYCQCDRVIAFTPQIEIDPKLVQEYDTRYFKFTKKIKHFVHPHVRDCFMDNVEYYIFYPTGDPIDTIHSTLIPVAANITLEFVNFKGHAVPVHWKQQGVLVPKLKHLIKPI